MTDSKKTNQEYYSEGRETIDYLIDNRNFKKGEEHNFKTSCKTLQMFLDYYNDSKINLGEPDINGVYRINYRGINFNLTYEKIEDFSAIKVNQKESNKKKDKVKLIGTSKDFLGQFRL